MYVHWLMLVLLVGWSIFFIYTLFGSGESRSPRANTPGCAVIFRPIWREGWRGGGDSACWVCGAALGEGGEQSAGGGGVDRDSGDGPAVQLDGALCRGGWEDGTAGPGAVERQRSVWGGSEGDPNAADDVVVQGNIVVPVNKPVIVHLTSLDVIHSFAIKSMRVCQDAIPGMTIPTWFKPVQGGGIQDHLRAVVRQFALRDVWDFEGGFPGGIRPQWLAEQSAKARSSAAEPVATNSSAVGGRCHAGIWAGHGIRARGARQG
jgi:hypothetical protein